MVLGLKGAGYRGGSDRVSGGSQQGVLLQDIGGGEMNVGKNPDFVKEAANALSDLNIFYAVIALMDGGLVHSPSHAAAARIVKLCRSEGGRCLKRYDHAKACAETHHADIC
jgi:hypothetical protein